MAKLLSILSLSCAVILAESRQTIAEVVDVPKAADVKAVPDMRISAEAMLEIATNGRLAGIYQGCGGKWEGFYLAFMKSRRAQGYDGEQMAGFGMFFGAYQGFAEQKIVPSDCTAGLKQDIEAVMQRRIKVWSSD
jgi:hypothetical protein